jgi:hypothetical protein
MHQYLGKLISCLLIARLKGHHNGRFAMQPLVARDSVYYSTYSNKGELAPLVDWHARIIFVQDSLVTSFKAMINIGFIPEDLVDGITSSPGRFHALLYSFIINDSIIKARSVCGIGENHLQCLSI